MSQNFLSKLLNKDRKTPAIVNYSRDSVVSDKTKDRKVEIIDVKEIEDLEGAPSLEFDDIRECIITD